MKKRHFLLAVLGIGLGLVGSSNVQANDTGYYRTLVDRHPLSRAVREFGGRVHTLNCTKGEAYGYFTRGNVIVCGNRMTSAALAEETLAHEAVHFAQHCVQPRDGGGIFYHESLRNKAIKDGFSVAWADEAAERHKKDGHAIFEQEWEAYYFEDDVKAVLDIVKTYCSVDLSQF